MKIKKRNVFRIIWFCLITVFFMWQWSTFQSRNLPKDALVDSDKVRVEQNRDKITFHSKNSRIQNEIIFFQGGLADPLAYVPLCRQISENGYTCHLMKMKWRMPQWDYMKITKIFDLKEGDYILGGHSQGAKMASQFIYENPNVIQGLFLMGTSHPREFDLSNRTIPTIKLYAEHDGLASVEEVMENRMKLPKNYVLKEIEGGNHSQFGYLGKLLTDKPPEISLKEQQKSTLHYLLEFFNSLSQSTALKAHAHNDYEHPRPLFLALEHGFMSVEADVHLIDEVLYVTHDTPKSISSTPNLEELYLKPLQKYIDQNGGHVYANYNNFFYLIIDIKSTADQCYPVLMDLLKKYESIISVVRENRDQTDKPVKVLLSGNRPVEQLLSQKIKYAGLDGRPPEIVENHPMAVMPLISENYNKYLSWNGNGEPDARELAELIRMIETAHAQNKKVRLWAAPDTPEAWELLLSIGIDLINTDRIVEFKEFADYPDISVKTTAH